MSCPIAKASRSKFKDARQNPAPDKTKRATGKKSKPIRVQLRWKGPVYPRVSMWFFFGRYKDVETAKSVMDKQIKKWGSDKIEMRIE